MQIKCKRCGSAIPAENVNLNTSLAKCGECNSVFDFSTQVETQAPARRSFDQAPKGIDVRTTMDGLTLERRWMNPTVWFLVLFCVFWDGFMVVWFTIAITQEHYEMAAFGSIHALVGVCLTYALVCNFVNKTWISITARNLSIKHGPLPWFGNKEIPSHEIEQVFCQRRVTRNKNGTSISYHVRYLDTRGKEGKLLGGLKDSSQALYLEQEIESTLGIQDRKVPGDYR